MGIVDLSEKHRRRANKAQTAEFFDVSIKTVDSWVRRGCPVVERGGKSVPWVFDLPTVAKWYFSPQLSAETPDPDGMTPQDRKAWYESEVKRRDLQERDRVLLSAQEVEVGISTAFAAASQALLGLTDTIERRSCCDPSVLTIADEVIANTLETLSDSLSSLGPVSTDE